jgi:flagellar biosynthesis GTPase FlhF
MKLYYLPSCLFILLAIAAAPLRAQTDPGAGFEIERQRINAERSKLQGGFLAEDIACYKKFAVNSCLEKVNERRREAMADLRRQEILINDQERRSNFAKRKKGCRRKVSRMQSIAGISRWPMNGRAWRMMPRSVKREQRDSPGSRQTLMQGPAGSGKTTTRLQSELCARLLR